MQTSFEVVHNLCVLARDVHVVPCKEFVIRIIYSSRLPLNNRAAISANARVETDEQEATSNSRWEGNRECFDGYRHGEIARDSWEG